MKMLRICDNDTKLVNAMLKGETESCKVNVQGFNGLLEITRDSIVTNCTINGLDYEFDKPVFRVCNEQVIKGVQWAVKKEDGTIKVQVTNMDDTAKARSMMGEFVSAKYNGSACLYNMQLQEVVINFEALLYNFEKISTNKEENE